MVGFSWILSKDGESEDVAEREDMVVDVMVLKFGPGRMLCAATAICDLSKILLVSMRLLRRKQINFLPGSKYSAVVRDDIFISEFLVSTFANDGHKSGSESEKHFTGFDELISALTYYYRLTKQEPNISDQACGHYWPNLT